MSSSSESRPLDTPEGSDSFLDGGISEQEQATARHGPDVNFVEEEREVWDQGEPQPYLILTCSGKWLS